VLSLSPLLLIYEGECVCVCPCLFYFLHSGEFAGLNRTQENCLPDHLCTECHLVFGRSSCRDYFFNTSDCSVTKLHLYPMWVLRRISQDSGDNTVCCNPFLLILLFNYSYMHSSVNVSSFTGILHISLMIKDVKNIFVIQS
jgi:hypothetical protein